MVKYGPSPRSPCVGREPVRGKKSPYAGGFRGSCIFNFSLFIYFFTTTTTRVILAKVKTHPLHTEGIEGEEGIG